MSVHFHDRDPEELKRLIGPKLKEAILLTEPYPRDRREVIDRFQRLWPMVCAAHYDLGWPYMRVRDRLYAWMVRIVLSLPIDLDEENRSSGWTKTPRRELANASADPAARRPSFQIGHNGTGRT